MNGEAIVAGIDGARHGWVACTVNLTSSTVTFRQAPSLGALWDERWVAVGIDMPLGLPARERRSADTDARRILGTRHSTLFATPLHATLAADTYPDALARSRAAGDRGLSKQAFNLLPRIREVRRWLEGPRPHVHEVHPETSFTVMNRGTPLVAKTTNDGRRQRRGLLAAWIPALPGDLDAAAVPVIDALDAAAAAWTAARVSAGTHLVLGDDGVDPDGYRLTMAV